MLCITQSICGISPMRRSDLAPSATWRATSASSRSSAWYSACMMASMYAALLVKCPLRHSVICSARHHHVQSAS